MAEYIVKPGDTLSKIATGKLGSAGKWRVIAELNGIVNPDRIRVGQRLQLPGEVTEVPSVVNTAEGVQAVSKERIQISVEDKVVYATLLTKPEKIFVGRLHRKGLYRGGGWYHFSRQGVAYLRGDGLNHGYWSPASCHWLLVTGGIVAVTT